MYPNTKEYIMKRIRTYVKLHKEYLEMLKTEDERYKNVKEGMEENVEVYANMIPTVQADYNRYIILCLEKEGLMGDKIEKIFHVNMTMANGNFRKIDNLRVASKADVLRKIAKDLDFDTKADVINITIVEHKREEY